MKQVSQLLLISLAFFLASCNLYGPTSNGPPVVPGPGPSPAESLKTLVTPLRGIISDEKDAGIASQFFLDFADVVERDVEIVKSTQQLRAGYIRAETLLLQRTDMVGRYPGFGAAKDAVLKQVLGLENVSLTAEKRSKAVEAFKAIAWAIRNPVEAPNE